MVPEFSGGDIPPSLSNLIKFDHFNAIWICWGERIKLLTLENEFFPLTKE